jgi:hypothetical protein
MYETPADLGLGLSWDAIAADDRTDRSSCSAFVLVEQLIAVWSDGAGRPGGWLVHYYVIVHCNHYAMLRFHVELKIDKSFLLFH